jgi:hypothetical protein
VFRGRRRCSYPYLRNNEALFQSPLKFSAINEVFLLCRSRRRCSDPSLLVCGSSGTRSQGSTAGEEVTALDVRAMGAGAGRRVEPRRLPIVEPACGSWWDFTYKKITAKQAARTD